jgi:hypothetical protein
VVLRSREQLIRYLHFSENWKNASVQKLLLTSKRPVSVSKEVFQSIPHEFGVIMKLVRLIDIHLSETYSIFHLLYEAENVPMEGKSCVCTCEFPTCI